MFDCVWFDCRLKHQLLQKVISTGVKRQCGSSSYGAMPLRYQRAAARIDAAEQYVLFLDS
jgi:hypothetical protein